MMKRKATGLILLSALCLLAASCYKDLSTPADHEIPDIVVTGLAPEIHVTYGEELDITVQVSQEGRTASDFDLVWSIDLNPDRQADRIEELETGPTLHYKVANRPADAPYILRLDVTDPRTGLTKVVYSKLYVASSLGEGLLVAYTRDGGKTSEFDFFANEYVTYGYESEETLFTREIYRLANENTFEGKVLSMAAIVDSDGASYNEMRILAGTDDHLFALDPLTFKQTAADAALFNSSIQSEFGTTAIFNFASYQTGALIGGRLFVMPTLMDRVFSAASFPLEPRNVMQAHNSAWAAFQGGNFAFFDEVHARFFLIYGWSAHQGAFEEISSAPLGFSVQGAKCIGTGEMRGKSLAFLLCDATGTYHVCIIGDMDTAPRMSPVTIPQTALDEAVSVAFCDNCDLMYYATPRELYVTLLAAGRVSNRKVNWTPDSPDERITSIRQYTQGFKGTHNYAIDWYPYPIATNRLQMIITTYNDKTGEGKVYLRPFNVSTGLFTAKDNGTYGGFGEITALCPTLR